MCAEPDIKPPKNDKDYVEHWMRQSELFWSRLQSATVLHSGVLIGWYQIKSKEVFLRAGILFFGIIISGFLIAIMARDADYMKRFRDICGIYFPHCEKGNGRACAYWIIGILMGIELVLLTLTIYSFTIQIHTP